MDPLERADAALARARARGSYVVTPESAISPMDAASTLQIPRAMITAALQRDEDPDATMVVPAALMSDERTQSMPSPVPPHARQQQYQPQQPPPTTPLPVQQPPEPVHEEVGGFLPTTTQRQIQRSLTQRLDGN